MSKEELLKNYHKLSLKPLDSIIIRKEFTYRLLKRDIGKFIYTQHNEDGTIGTYEVFKNKIGDLRKVKERWAKLSHSEFNPEDYQQYYEIFPSDSEFGRRAWTYANLDDALKRYDSI